MAENVHASSSNHPMEGARSSQSPEPHTPQVTRHDPPGQGQPYFLLGQLQVVDLIASRTTAEGGENWIQVNVADAYNNRQPVARLIWNNERSEHQETEVPRQGSTAAGSVETDDGDIEAGNIEYTPQRLTTGWRPWLGRLRRFRRRLWARLRGRDPM
ncbi:hypothetical protein H2203_003831 [Taxawa tesnikishii (nom. ined.)]|nr:hypothetical protein H2203_003831 [Dothideales sp. JES 119]